MSLRRMFFLGLLLLLLFLAVPPAFAQSMGDIELEDIIDALGPREGEQLLLDILLYLIFFIGFITSFLVPDKQMFAQVLIFTVVGLALVAKLLVGDHASAIMDQCDLPVLIINVIIFVAPLIAAGGLRSVKGKRSKAMAPAIITGLLGGGYFFMFWFIEQREGCESAGSALNALYHMDVIQSLVSGLPF